MLSLNLLGLVVMFGGLYSYNDSNELQEDTIPTQSVTIQSVKEYQPFSIYTYNVPRGDNIYNFLPFSDSLGYYTPEWRFDTSFTYTSEDEGQYILSFGSWIYTFDYQNDEFIVHCDISYDNSDTRWYGFNVLPYGIISFRCEGETHTYIMYNTMITSTSTASDFGLTLGSFGITDYDTAYIDNIQFEFGFLKFTAEDYEDSITSAYNDGYNKGLEIGKNDNSNYQNGYNKGYADAKNIYENQDENINSIFNGILDVGMLPLNFFLTIFNFEIFGINIAGIVGGILTIFLLVMLIRLILGGKDGD